MLDLIYVHVDMTSNAVLSKGITRHDFTQTIVHRPENLLLLNTSAEEGEYNLHTGLKMIRTSEQVEQYFNLLQRQKVAGEVKWIDFSDVAMLKELTPLEISELLYFGHMKTSLHSPFFYKLQNNFVFFELSDETTRIYYRYMDEFYHILVRKIQQVVAERVNDRKAFFRRAITVEKLPIDLLKELKMMLQEGVVLCFQQMTLQDKEYRIPLHLVEDSLWKTKNFGYQKEPIVATLVYHANTQVWTIEMSEDEALNEFKK